MVPFLNDDNDIDEVSILILLDYLFLLDDKFNRLLWRNRVSILILLDYLFLLDDMMNNIKDFTKVSILILLDYLFLFWRDFRFQR